MAKRKGLSESDEKAGKLRLKRTRKKDNIEGDVKPPSQSPEFGDARG